MSAPMTRAMGTYRAARSRYVPLGLSKQNPAWPFWYALGGQRFVVDDFGTAIAVHGVAGIRFAREGLSEHLAAEFDEIIPGLYS